MAEGVYDTGLLCLSSHRNKRENKYEDANLFLLALDVQFELLLLHRVPTACSTLTLGKIVSVCWRYKSFGTHASHACVKNSPSLNGFTMYSNTFTNSNLVSAIRRTNIMGKLGKLVVLSLWYKLLLLFFNCRWNTFVFSFVMPLNRRNCIRKPHLQNR
jgi:hypothetical protein